MGRGRVWIAALALATAPAVAAQEAKPPAAGEEPKPSIALPTLGVVVPLPREAGRVDVEVDAKGRIFVGGKVHTMAALEKALAEHSHRIQIERQPGGTDSRVVLRVDRDLPWQASQWLVETCSQPIFRVYRLYLAARPEDAVEAEDVACFPPFEYGSPRKEAGASLVPVAVRLEYGETETPVAPADLYPFLRTRHPDLDGRKTAFTIEAAPTVPTGDVLAAADAAVRHGAKSVFLRACQVVREKDLPEAVAALPARKGGLVLTVLGTRVLPPGKDAPRMPPLRREKGLVPTAADLILLMERPFEDEIEGGPLGPGEVPFPPTKER